MIRAIQAAQFSGSSVTWEGNNLTEIKEVAGDAFAGMESEYVIIHNQVPENSHYAYLQHGWTLARIGQYVMVCSEAAAAVLFTDAQEAAAGAE